MNLFYIICILIVFLLFVAYQYNTKMFDGFITYNEIDATTNLGDMLGEQINIQKREINNPDYMDKPPPQLSKRISKMDFFIEQCIQWINPSRSNADQINTILRETFEALTLLHIKTLKKRTPQESKEIVAQTRRINKELLTKIRPYIESLIPESTVQKTVMKGMMTMAEQSTQKDDMIKMFIQLIQPVRQSPDTSRDLYQLLAKTEEQLQQIVLIDLQAGSQLSKGDKQIIHEMYNTLSKKLTKELKLYSTSNYSVSQLQDKIINDFQTVAIQPLQNIEQTNVSVI